MSKNDGFEDVPLTKIDPEQDITAQIDQVINSGDNDAIIALAQVIEEGRNFNQEVKTKDGLVQITIPIADYLNQEYQALVEEIKGSLGRLKEGVQDAPESFISKEQQNDLLQKIDSINLTLDECQNKNFNFIVNDIKNRVYNVEPGDGKKAKNNYEMIMLRLNRVEQDAEKMLDAKSVQEVNSFLEKIGDNIISLSKNLGRKAVDLSKFSTILAKNAIRTALLVAASPLISIYKGAKKGAEINKKAMEKAIEPLRANIATIQTRLDKITDSTLQEKDYKMLADYFVKAVQQNAWGQNNLPGEVKNQTLKQKIAKNLLLDEETKVKLGEYIADDTNLQQIIRPQLALNPNTNLQQFNNLLNKALSNEKMDTPTLKGEIKKIQQDIKALEQAYDKKQAIAKFVGGLIGAAVGITGGYAAYSLAKAAKNTKKEISDKSKQIKATYKKTNEIEKSQKVIGNFTKQLADRNKINPGTSRNME